MILAARTIVLCIIVPSLASCMTSNENITHFILGSAFAQTANTGDNSTDFAIPQDNSTDPSLDNSTDLGIPQDNSTDLGTPLDNSTYQTSGLDNLTGTQNQTSNAVPEFPAALTVLVGAISSLIVFFRINPFKI
jgi:hypothetical protein